MWGRLCKFAEKKTYCFFQQERPSEEDILSVVRGMAHKIASEYTYDCGDKHKPLKPFITHVEIVPEAEAMSLFDEKFDCEDIFKSYEIAETDGN